MSTDTAKVMVTVTVTVETDRLISTKFTANGQRGEIVTYLPRARCRQEVYREYREYPGLMQFLGYYDEIAHTIPRVAEVAHPFVAINRRVLAERRARRAALNKQ